MGTFTIILVVLVVLSIIGGGASTFFGNVTDGIKNSLQFVENSPTLKNLSQETQHFVQQQANDIVKEIN